MNHNMNLFLSGQIQDWATETTNSPPQNALCVCVCARTLTHNEKVIGCHPSDIILL